MSGLQNPGHPRPGNDAWQVAYDNLRRSLETGLQRIAAVPDTAFGRGYNADRAWVDEIDRIRPVADRGRDLCCPRFAYWPRAHNPECEK